jgi:hypothetical protein
MTSRPCASSSLPARPPNPVEIAEKGSAAFFEVYAGTEWDAHRRGATPIARIIGASLKQ